MDGSSVNVLTVAVWGARSIQRPEGKVEVVQRSKYKFRKPIGGVDAENAADGGQFEWAIEILRVQSHQLHPGGPGEKDRRLGRSSRYRQTGRISHSQGKRRHRYVEFNELLEYYVAVRTELNGTLLVFGVISSKMVENEDKGVAASIIDFDGQHIVSVPGASIALSCISMLLSAYDASTQRKRVDR